MEQPVHDKSETFKIIYKALLLEIIGMVKFKKYIDTNVFFKQSY